MLWKKRRDPGDPAQTSVEPSHRFRNGSLVHWHGPPKPGRRKNILSGVVVQTWPDRIGIQVQDSKATLMIPPNLVWLDGEDPLEPPR